MEIRINSIIILDDDKKYIVVSKVNYKGKIYLYIIEKDNPANLRICEQIDDDLIDIEDEKLINDILIPFYKEARNNYLNENDIN